jgi:hypothetical protein
MTFQKTYGYLMSIIGPLTTFEYLLYLFIFIWGIFIIINVCKNKFDFLNEDNN